MSNSEINPYKSIDISNIKLHMGNGAKNKLKEETKLFNFKFFYKVGIKYKQVSAGFDTIEDFLKFIKPINSYYYIYEYIFENRACCPYFDYEFELDTKPSEQKIIKYLVDIKKNIIGVFDTMFQKKLKPEQIKILNSHGLKSNSKYKISWHIIIGGYHFSSNSQCAYVCEKLKELDEAFDISVYSKDRMMRTYCSAKNWDDLRILREENEIKPDISKLTNYLITHIKPDSIKLKCSREIKKEVEKKKYIRTKVDKKIKPDEIGHQIESILKSNYHEDTYYTKSVEKHDGIIFYSFNYTNRNKKCFTGFTHDNIGFYCWVDSCANIILKCFSQKCSGCKKIIGNLNKTNSELKALVVESDYLNKSQQVNELLKTFEKVLLIKSQMGTGKTELVCDYIDKFTPQRILWISTRQTYSHNINERLSKYGFVNYLDDKENWIYKPKVIVQLESLTKLEKAFKIRSYDLVVLDEIESILYHFDSDTIALKSSQTFDLMYMLCKFANTKIICMDADLSLRTIEFAKDLNPGYKFVINKYKKSDIIINLVDSKDWLIGEIKKSIDAKLNCCIISLSTRLLYQIEDLLKEWKIKYLIHTRESDDKFKKELAKVNDLWVNYQVVLFSPTISVGVDFTKVHFDKIFGILTPNTASPRTLKQMFGRLRVLKNHQIDCYYQNITISTDTALYNYNEMIGYFKYADIETKTTKKYILKEDSSLEVISGFGLYDRIMMHNRIENLNKLGNTFMTQFAVLCEDSNYRLQFISKSQAKIKKVELNDDVYKDKIINAQDIKDDDKYKDLYEKLITNKATETEKFSIQKYKFKNFWNLEKVDKKSLELYFRCELVLNRLLHLMDLDIINIDEYVDRDMEKKTKVITNIIKTLGFDLANLELKISREQFYINAKILFGETNEFKKDYANIRILFGKDKHELTDDLKGSALVKLLNGFLNEFGLELKHKHSTKKIDNKTIFVYFYKIICIKKFENYTKH